MELPKGLTETQIGACITPRFQELILFPTEKCNFRCTYCYEDFLIGKMPKWVQTGVERLISRRAPELEKLQLSWFGGEPLLAKDVILRIARHAYEESQRHGFSMVGSFTTNGYLLTEKLIQDFLALHHNFFQISLDGWREVHDVTRRLANGRGTFERIWENLSTLRAQPGSFEVVLRVHVSRTNLESLDRLCSEIAKEFGDDNRFRVDFQDIRNMGGEGGKTVAPLTSIELYEAVQRLGRIIQAGRSSAQAQPIFSSKLDNTGESAGGRRSDDLAAGSAYICYASRPNSMMIRANGRLGKCTVALDSPSNDVGHLCEDGSLAINNPKLRRWFHGLQSLDLPSLGCPLHALPKEVFGADMSTADEGRRRNFPLPVRVDLTPAA